MRGLDFSSWQALLSTVLGLTLVTLMMVGIRLAVMQRVQQHRERENRQINERLRTLIAAYKTLGGSFTGDLAVDPTHRRGLAVRLGAGEAGDAAEADQASDQAPEKGPETGSERARRIRDAVEAALSDVILLGTEQQVRLAARAAAELAVGHPVHTAELVVCLRDFIRKVLDLDPVPADVSIPVQGPARPSVSRGGASADKDSGKDRQGGQGGTGAGMGAGMGAGVGTGMGLGGVGSEHGSHAAEDTLGEPHSG